MNEKIILAPLIPTTIVVHLGKPDEAAKNITVPFQEYIKNVASSEIYPTWPEDALRANILAQISFTLNRLYNEWYRSKGYDFEITSSPAYDQAFKEDRAIFENISLIVDDLFNDYVIQGPDHIEPLYAVYCDGRNTTCNGLSQWGTVSLANQGKKTEDILKYYYGQDIEIINDAPTSAPIVSYPGVPLKLGDGSEFIRIIKRQLNRIGINYPAIPKITKINQYFDVELENAVKKFQEIFNLKVTGIIDKSTWYKIKYIYTSVAKVADLAGVGITAEDVEVEFGFELTEGSTAGAVRDLHYILGVIAYFDNDIPLLEINGVYDKNTITMVKAFQSKYGLPVTGTINVPTLNKLLDVYQDTRNNIPSKYIAYIDEIYPGRFLSISMTGDDVIALQRFLYIICSKEKSIPGVRVTGEFDVLTESSIKTLEKRFGQEVNGVVGPVLWKEIVDLTKSLT